MSGLLSILSIVLSSQSSFAFEVNEHEQTIGQWLDLNNGGIADGPSQSKTGGPFGALENGTPLPLDGPGFHRLCRSAQHNSWGAGFMISLLENSAQVFNSLHPDKELYIGAIAEMTGGVFPPHLSHQNGLDVDILFVGTNTYASVLDHGAVTDRFDAATNWEYWRSLTSQKILQDGKEIPVVAMILVAPELKAYLCDWTKSHGHDSLPEDIDLLKRLRPTEGHDTHFHVRLQCSPYHSKCARPWDPGLNANVGC